MKRILFDGVASADTRRKIGRYVVGDEIASGGMGTVHIGRMSGPMGFSRAVAVKRLHANLAKEPDFLAMFVDEARLASRIQHPNVAQTLDVVVEGDDVLVVMEYIHGESLSALLRRSTIPLDVATAIVVQMLYGLHAAHEATDPTGKSLELVHRDVSPHNVVVGTDGVARLLDFGVAKAVWRLHNTRDGALKGKLGYMAPEQLAWEPVDRRADIFAATVVLWEVVTGRRLFGSGSASEPSARVRTTRVDPPSHLVANVPPALDAIVARGLAHAPADRFETALAMANAIEAELPRASQHAIGEWVKKTAAVRLEQRTKMLRSMEADAGPADAESPPDAFARMAEAASHRDEPTQGFTPSDVLIDHTEAAVSRAAEPEAAPTGKGRSRAPVWIALVLAAGFGVLGIGLIWRSASTPSTSSSPPASGSHLVGVVVAEPMDAAAATVRAPETPPAPPSASSPPSADVARAIERRPGKTRPSEPKRTPQKDPCDPNYTVDAKGKKHFKPECF